MRLPPPLPTFTTTTTTTSATENAATTSTAATDTAGNIIGSHTLPCRPPAYFFGPRSRLRNALARAAGAAPTGAPSVGSGKAAGSRPVGRFFESLTTPRPQSSANSSEEAVSVGGADWYEAASPVLRQGLSSEQHLQNLRYVVHSNSVSFPFHNALLLF